MTASHKIIYTGAMLTLMGLASCGDGKRATEPDGTGVETVILTDLQQRAELVTTEVRVRKLAIYDSSQHEHIELRDPRTWRWGERKCIVPVDVTIKYGYDLRDLAADDVQLSDDSTALVVLLPQPRVVDSGYEAKVDEAQIVRMSSGLRDRISHEEVEQLLGQTYRQVMDEDLSPLIQADVEHNAQVVIEGIVRGMGLKNTAVRVVHKDEWGSYRLQPSKLTKKKGGQE